MREHAKKLLIDAGSADGTPPRVQERGEDICSIVMVGVPCPQRTSKKVFFKFRSLQRSPRTGCGFPVHPPRRAMAPETPTAVRGATIPDSPWAMGKHGHVAPEVVFPTRTPGSILRGFRYRDELTQVELANLTGNSRHHISEMETNKRRIDVENARKFAAIFNTTPQMFLF